MKKPRPRGAADRLSVMPAQAARDTRTSPTVLAAPSFVDAADRRDFAGQTLQRRLVKLTLGIALLALVVGAVQVAHHLGDRQQITRVDLLLILLRPARPHGPLDLGLALQRVQRLGHHIGRRELAHADLGRLVRRNAQRHLVLFERDHEQLQRQAGNLLFFDRDDPSDAMRRIDHEFVRTEFRLLGLGHSVASPGCTPSSGDKITVRGLPPRR